MKCRNKEQHVLVYTQDRTVTGVAQWVGQHDLLIKVLLGLLLLVMLVPMVKILNVLSASLWLH